MQRILRVFVFGSIFFANFIPIKDPDFGWHYRCGSELLQGNPCISNTFSYYLTHYQWYNPSFLFDAITAITYNSIGFNGLSILYALIMTAVFYLIYSMSGKKLMSSFVGFSLILYLSSGTLGIGWRSQIITYGLFIFSYYILSRQPITISFWVYPLLMFIWVNTHIGFFIGIVLYALYEFQSMIITFRKKITIREFSFIFCVGVVAVLATFLNPFGWKVYIEIYRHAIAPLNTMIAEWVQPPIVQLVIMVLIYLITIAGRFMVKKISIFQFLTLTMLIVMTFIARRNIPLFYTIVLIQLLPLLPTIKKDLSIILLPPLIATFITTAVLQIRSTTTFHANWNTYFCSKGLSNFPCKALQQYPDISGNIYASYEYGGFLIWQKPDSKVFIDGRMSAWSNTSKEYAYQTYLKILQAQPGWNELLRKYHTDYILIGQGTFLDLLLDKEAQAYGWKKVYENESHIIYMNVL